MNIEEIAEHLQDVGYVVLEKPLRAKMSSLLLARCQDDDHERFQAAHVGRGLAKKQIHSMRGDVISWLDDTDSIDCTYLAWMEDLRIGLNKALYLGLFEYECHYAIYGTSAGYARHSDVLNGSRNRVLSTVFYLNEDWQACDGGELVLFEPIGDTIIATINPTFGKMIIYLSESFPHEVLAAHATRRSIAGWFRVRDFA
jgi:SM-20-related protein